MNPGNEKRRFADQLGPPMQAIEMEVGLGETLRISSPVRQGRGVVLGFTVNQASLSGREGVCISLPFDAGAKALLKDIVKAMEHLLEKLP